MKRKKTKNNDPLRFTNAAKILSSRLFSEKIWLTFFAASSLAFGLFYTFPNHTATATASDGAMPMRASTIENTESLNGPREISGTAAVSDVVSKALAFKALLTTAQQTTLEKTYTTTLARRWSNLPCGSNCRNGIQFST